MYVCMCVCVYTFVHEEYFLCGVVARACIFVEKSGEVTEVEWSKVPEKIGWPRVRSASLSQEGVGTFIPWRQERRWERYVPLWMSGHVEAGRKLRRFLPDGLGFRREVGAYAIC